jgi:D-alanine-D-alanine ligase
MSSLRHPSSTSRLTIESQYPPSVDPVLISTNHPSSRARVAVIGGGQNSEHDVSLASAAAVTRAIDPRFFRVVGLTIERDGGWSHAGRPISLPDAVGLLQSCDVAFPVLHGPRGEDGTLAALLDLAGVPFVGSGVRAGALAMDKWTTKLVAQAVGVDTANGTLLRRSDAPVVFDSPVVVKPVASGSSFGVSLVEHPTLLAGAVAEAFTFDDRVLVEERVVGREVDIGVLARPDGARVVGAPLEIVVPGSLFDLTTKYDGSADFRIPARLSPTLREMLERAAVAVFDALGCAGVARVDFFVTQSGIVLNEVNTMPGMTDLSQVPRMFDAIGMPYAELVHTLIVDAIDAAR